MAQNPRMSFFNKYSFLGTLVGVLYRLYSSTWRYEVQFVDDPNPVDFFNKAPDRSGVFAHWHGDELALIGLGKYSKFLTMSSHSKDGTIMAAGLKVMGFEVVRGSSTREGARAMIQLIRKLREGHYYVSFAMDGPKGPRHECKPGVHLFTYKIGIPLYQCMVKCEQKFEIPNTWNKVYIPKPFAKVKVYFYRLPEVTKDNRDEIIGILNSRTAILSTA